MSAPRSETSDARAGALRELLVLFLRLGVTAFGGPAAHIAMMEDEVVHRRGWLTKEEFVDWLGATNLIPGPNSTEMAMHIGRERAGWRGLVVAGTAFIVPAALITGAIAWAYVRFGARPEAEGLMYGIKPVVIAVILQALWRLAPTVIKSVSLGILGALAVVAVASGVGEIAVLVLTGLATLALRRGASRIGSAVVVMSPPALAMAPLAVAVPFSLVGLFVAFVKMGSVLFGSGYVLLAFLRSEFVERLHWLSEATLLDAVAVGQMTPGPVFTTATFVGYVLGRGPGAVVATIGIFLPAFIFVAVSAVLVPRLRASSTFKAFLEGVNVASLALMAFVAWRLAQAAIVDVLSGAIALVSAILLVRFRWNSTWLIALGAAAGMARAVLH